MRTGSRVRVPMANIADQSVDVMGSLNMRSARETVNSLGLFKKRRGPRKSSQRQ